MRDFIGTSIYEFFNNIGRLRLSDRPIGGRQAKDLHHQIAAAQRNCSDCC